MTKSDLPPTRRALPAALAALVLVLGPARADGALSTVTYPTGALALSFLSAVAGAAGYRVTQGFGDHPRRADPETGETVDPYGYGAAGHTGWDIALGRPGKDGAKGAAVHAPFAGKVYIGEQRAANGAFVGLGRWAKLVAPNGASVTFGHLGAFGGLKSGAPAAKGATLGFEGTTGNSTGYHVHVMVRDARGRIVDPGGAGGVQALAPGGATIAKAAPARTPAAKTVAAKSPAKAPAKTTASAARTRDPAAVAAAESRARAARVAYDAAQEVYAVGGLAKTELDRLRAAADAADRSLAGVRAGAAPAPAPSTTAAARARLDAAEAAYRAAVALFDAGGVARQEVREKERALTEARAAWAKASSD